ncbi:hypothetical protein LTR78_009460 [Recurvomyces mirabilis]|uniref:MmgE/PrpD family protein n=1 Tax=Recurvomyces mirabilis TaxID=574656 RepID=A0AAE0TPB5_9PEZI|nr:hypothetical protein LTR78_009460 [Recurvomyces mirabilis]KAK5152365.1 hypothetical protein LTS14_008312 [Recurvomyces mirabilis]
MTSQRTNQGSQPTAALSAWIAGLSTAKIPAEIITRAKYLVLDGIACGLVGAQLPWSQQAAAAIFELEPQGDATVIGWNRKIPALSAALLNSSFIQGFELDDWHSEAPLHSNSILLPALLAASQHQTAQDSKAISGADFLLAMITGYETGPRVGLGLYGTHILSTGWHSGAVFGPAACAAAVSKLFGLNADQVEDALARLRSTSGLLAACLARNGYTGIRGVLEQEYGGFLKQFSLGNGKSPPFRSGEIIMGLGSVWQTNGVRIKPYAAMAGTHPTIDGVRALQASDPEQMREISGISKITIELGEAAYHHGGWQATRPITATGAQMSNMFVAATQIVHGQVLPAQFRHDMLENDDVWRLVEMSSWIQSSDPDTPFGRQTVTIDFSDGSKISHQVEAARGVDPALSNEEIVAKLETPGW